MFLWNKKVNYFLKNYSFHFFLKASFCLFCAKLCPFCGPVLLQKPSNYVLCSQLVHVPTVLLHNEQKDFNFPVFSQL